MDHIWVMVDQNGAQTLFQLVEVGVGPDASRLVKELHLPAVLIDVALPAKHFGAKSAPRSGREQERARLVVVKVHTGDDGDAVGLAVHTNVGSGPTTTSSTLVS